LNISGLPPEKWLRYPALKKSRDSKSTNTADFYFASEFENESDYDGLVPEFFKEKKL
jgi:hypothetical protein